VVPIRWDRLSERIAHIGAALGPPVVMDPIHILIFQDSTATSPVQYTLLNEGRDRQNIQRAV
jgi:hypothetical protein